MRKLILVMPVIASAVLIAGCGGGGSGSGGASGPAEQITISITPQYGLNGGSLDPIAQFAIYVDGKFVNSTSEQIIGSGSTKITSIASVNLSPGSHTVSLTNSLTGLWPPSSSYTSTSPVYCSVGFSGPTAFEITPPNLPQESVTSYGPALEGEDNGVSSPQFYFTIVIQ